MGLVHNPLIVTDGLELCFDAANKRSFGDGSSQWKDLGKRKKHATLVNMSAANNFSTFRLGNLAFDGTSEKISIPTIDISSYSEITLIQWAKRSSATNRSFSILHSNSNDLGIYWGAAGNPSVRLNDGTLYKVDFSASDNEVMQVAMTFDGSTLKCYKNGYLVGSTSASFDFSTANGAASIGNHAADVSSYFNGTVYSTFLYSRALSQEEITKNYINTRTKFMSPEPPVPIPTTFNLNIDSEPDGKVYLDLESDGVYNFTIDWGDESSNTITTYNDANAVHTYSATGSYDIVIDGAVSGLDLQYAASSAGGSQCGYGVCPGQLPWFYRCCTTEPTGYGVYINSIESWGQFKIDTTGTFNGQTSSPLALPTQAPEITTANLERTFYGATNFNSNINSWDVSSVTGFYNMFYNCRSFNQDLSNWDMSSATSIQSMFYQCFEFNGDVSTWDVSNITNMKEAFRAAYNFNSDLSSWDTASLTGDQHGMFASCSGQFNSNVGNFKMGNVTTASWMFYECKQFNNGGSSSISGWDVSNVTTMENMFYNAENFNQPIGSWDTSSCTNFKQMFAGATSFDQDISNWDFTNAYLEGMENGSLCMFNCNYVNVALWKFFLAAGLSTSNYDALLISWKDQAAANTNFRGLKGIDMGSSTYTANSTASAARATLVNSYGFTITDGGSV